MSLQEKLINLKLNAALAVKHANGWQNLIDKFGLEKATEFYKSLGLNHLQSKSYDYEGLSLSREPKEHEKIAVKGIAQAQESSKEAVSKILLDMRTELIEDGLKRIKKLKPASYHALVLETPATAAATLKERLIKVYRQGQNLVAHELSPNAKELTGIWPHECPFDFGVKAAEEDEFEDLDELTDLTGSRVVNDVQSRLIAAAQRFRLAGLTGAELINAVTNDINGGSAAYIDRAAAGVANRVIGLGRLDEMRNRADEIDRYEQSELLDQNTCGPCADDDGKTASDPSDLPGAPNPSCEGADYCRGFIVAIAPGG